MVEEKAAKILIIDDEKGNRDMLSLNLKEQGYVVKAVNSGEKGLALLKKERFDLVTTDLKMPGLSGEKVIERLKQFDSEIEIIVITGYATLESAIKVLKYGAADYLKKPVDYEELIIAVERALKKRELQETLSIYNASKAIMGSLRLKELSKVIVESVMKIVKADDASLMLLDKDMHLFIAYSHGLGKDIQRQVRLKIGERISGKVAQEKKPLIIEGNINNDSRFKGIEGKKGINSSIVYPLLAKNKILGVLSVNRTNQKESFSRRDLRKLGIISSEITLAIENANLYREAEEKIELLQKA
jgi:DNA-binding response OmpR family regulator